MSYYLYVFGEEDDFGDGGRFSYRCPQAIVDMDYGRYSKKHNIVVMRDFPTDRLNEMLLPNRDMRINDATTWLAIYYGLVRFRDKIGMFPATVRTCDEEVMTVMMDGIVPERCWEWCEAVFNVKWMGVSFELTDEDDVKGVIYGVSLRT